MSDVVTVVPAWAWLALVGGGDLVREWTVSAPQLGLNLLLIAFLVFLNGFFVAAEFAIVKVRSSQLDALIEVGKKRAVYAKHVTEHMDGYLSACQLGITLASLGLGWVGEPYLSRLIQPLFFDASGNPMVGEQVIRWFSFAVGFGIITFLHIVLGEMLPKSLAIRRSLGTTLHLSRPLGLFYTVFRLPIYLLNASANKMLRLLFRIEPAAGHEMLHSAEELKLLLEETEKSQEVTDTEREILIAALELNELHVRDVLTPRSDVITLDPGQPFDENLKVAVASGHTRFPLVDGHLDNTIGLIHIKDLLRGVAEGKKDLVALQRSMPTVPETMALDDLLKFFLKQQVHLALVVDEFGGTLGIVMLDNVIEELVGDIQDEFDTPEEEREFYPVSDDEFVVEGSMSLYELSEHSELRLESSDVSTIGGYVTHLLGRIPERGEEVEIDGFEARVVQTDGKSVGKVRFKRLPPPADEDGAGAPVGSSGGKVAESG